MYVGFFVNYGYTDIETADIVSVNKTVQFLEIDNGKIVRRTNEVCRQVSFKVF